MKYFKYIISLIVAGALLYFSFRNINWEDFMESLEKCNWVYLLAAFIVGIVAFYLRGLRWRILLLPIDNSISRLTTFNAINIGNISNFIFPRIGEFVRCGVVTNRSQYKNDIAAASEGAASEGSASSSAVSNKKKASYDKVVGTMVMERSWDLIAFIISIALVLVFMWEKVRDFFVTNIFSSLSELVSMKLGVIIALLFIGFIVLWYCIWKFRDKWPFVKKTYEVFNGILTGFLSGLRMKNKWLFILYTVLIWGAYWVMSYLTILSLPELGTLDMSDALFLMVAGSLGWLIPVPGGIGAFHFVVATALSTVYALPFSLGIIFATLSHESQMLSMILTGGISYLSESLFKKKI